MRRIIGAVLVLCVIVLMVSCNIVNRREVTKAKHFCERLFPYLEDAKQRGGAYPQRIEPEWIKGEPIPSLISTNSFYESGGSFFWMRFEAPLAYWDNWYGYHSGTKHWVRFDKD